jgi:hypothetical protein
MSGWWLLLIVPAVFSAGYWLATVQGARNEFRAWEGLE